MIYVWGLLAAFVAVATEAYYRSRLGVPWGLTLWPGLIGALAINFAVFQMLQHGSILALAVVFALFSAALRVVFTLAAGDVVSTGTWVAFGLVVAASLVKVGLK